MQLILLPVWHNQPLDEKGLILPDTGFRRGSASVPTPAPGIPPPPWVLSLFWPPPSQSVPSPVLSDWKLLGEGSRAFSSALGTVPCSVLFCSPANDFSLWTVADCPQRIWMWIKIIYFFKHTKNNLQRGSNIVINQPNLENRRKQEGKRNCRRNLEDRSKDAAYLSLSSGRLFESQRL